MAGVGSTDDVIVPVICPGHDRPVREVHFSGETEDGTFMVSACLDRKPYLRDGESGDWIGTFEGHRGAVWGAKINSEATLVATASADFSARLWNAVDGKVIQSWEHPHVVKSCDFAPDGTVVATGCRDGKCRVFNATKPAATAEVSIDAGSEVAAVAFNPSLPSEILVGTEEGLVCYSARAGTPTRTVDLGAASGKTGSTSTADGGKYDTGDDLLRVRDLTVARVATGGASAASKGAGKSGEGSGESDGKEWCATVCHGKRVSLFRLSDLKLLWSHRMERHPSADTASTSPDGAYFVFSGGEDCLEVGIAKASTGQVLKYEGGHHGPVRCVRFNPGGRRFTSASEDGTVRIWPYKPEAAELYFVKEQARLEKETEKEASS